MLLRCDRFQTCIKKGIWFLFILLSLGSSVGRSQSLFLNQNYSCQDEVVTGHFIQVFNIFSEAKSMACGQLGGSLTHQGTEAIDCITQVDSYYSGLEGANTNDLIYNTGILQNNCFNSGGEKQFEAPISLVNTSFSVEVTEPLRAGTISVGNINGQGYDDIAWNYPFEVALNDQGLDPLAKSVQSLMSLDQGGFETNFLPKTTRLGIDFPDSQRPLNFPTDIYVEVPALTARGSERSLLLMNCDSDPVDEGIVATVRQDPAALGQTGFLVLENDPNNPGLQEPLLQDFVFFPAIALGNIETANVSLTSADFNQDGHLDIAAAFNRNADQDFPDDQVFLCFGDGACGFNCSQTYDLGVLAFPQSISSGDFDGDGDTDLVIAQSYSSTVKYLFNDPLSDLSEWKTQEVVLAANDLDDVARPLVISTGRFSREAFRRDGKPSIDEVVVASPRYNQFDDFSFASEQFDSTIEIIETDGQSGFKSPPTQLKFVIEESKSVSGVVADRFYACGGDSLMALSTFNCVSEVCDTYLRHVSYFANANEAPEIQLSSQLSANNQNSIEIPAECYDPTHDDSTYQWSVIEAPAGAQYALQTTSGKLQNGTNSAETVLTGDYGRYILRLDCQDICGMSAFQNIQIDLLRDGVLPAPSIADLNNAESETELLSTEGTCLANLNAPASKLSLVWFFWCIAVLMLRKRLGQRTS